MSDWLQAAVAVVACFTVSLVVTWRMSGARLLMDLPNERSLHERPTPRGGGVGILCGVAVGVCVMVNFPISPWVAGCTVLLAAVSIVDDARPLSATVRMAVHLVVALVLVAAGMVPQRYGLPGFDVQLPASLSAAFAVLYVIWMLNLFNFMDGMDGFAGGMAAIGFGCFAILGAQAGAYGFSALSAMIAAAAAGFLVFNFPPARIFMGDVGSVPLGFLAAALTLHAEREDIFAFWTGVLVFSPFVVDATVTLLRRLFAGERVWEAHRSHYYQRLVRSGWSHRRTVLSEYALMLACSASSVTAAWANTMIVDVAVSAAWIIGYTILLVILHPLPMRTP